MVGIENVVEEYLLNTYPRMTVRRQPYWGRIGRPDLVTFMRVGDHVAVSILELKRTTVNMKSLQQLRRYVLAASLDVQDTDIPAVVTGILVGFRFRPMDLPPWVTRWPLALEA